MQIAQNEWKKPDYRQSETQGVGPICNPKIQSSEEDGEVKREMPEHRGKSFDPLSAAPDPPNPPKGADAEGGLGGQNSV